MNAPTREITEQEARIALARIGEGGGYEGTRIDGGWLFVAFSSFKRQFNKPPLVVSDAGRVTKMDLPGLSLADAVRGDAN